MKRIGPDSLFVHYEGWAEVFDEEICSSEYALRLAPIGKHTPPPDDHQASCFRCKAGGDMLLCDGCVRVAHTACVGLSAVPRGKWFCTRCVRKGRQNAPPRNGGDAHSPAPTAIDSDDDDAATVGEQPAVKSADDVVHDIDDTSDDDGGNTPKDEKPPPPRAAAPQRKARKRSSIAVASSSAPSSPHSPKQQSAEHADGGVGAVVHTSDDSVVQEEDVKAKEEEKGGSKRKRRRNEATLLSLSPTRSSLNGSAASPDPAAISPAASSVSPSSSSGSGPKRRSATPRTANGSASSASSASRSRRKVSARGGTAETAPPAPELAIARPSVTSLLDCYLLAFDKARREARAGSPPSSSAPPSQLPPSALSSGASGARLDIPTFSFPSVCLTHEHRTLLVDFCRHVDADAAKPAIAVHASVSGLAQFRSLVDNLSEYRDFLERKINERMNASNEEKLQLDSRRSITESQCTETRQRHEHEAEEAEERSRHMANQKRRLLEEIEEKKEELRRLRDQAKILEAVEREEHAKLTREEDTRAEEQQDMDEKVKAIEDDRQKISDLLLVLQALREHVKEPADGTASEDRSPWEPLNTLRAAVLQMEEAKEGGQSREQSGHEDELHEQKVDEVPMLEHVPALSQQQPVDGRLRSPRPAASGSGALTRASRSVAVDADEDEDGDQSDSERYEGFGLLEQKYADVENDTGLASPWDDDDMPELISPTYMSSEYAGPSPVSSLSSTTSSAAAANDESHALASRGNSVSSSQSTAFVAQSQQRGYADKAAALEANGGNVMQPVHQRSSVDDDSDFQPLTYILGRPNLQ